MVQFLNTRQNAGDILEISMHMTIRNGRKVNVKLTKQQRSMIDNVTNTLCSPLDFKRPDVKLLVQITSDTFRGGLEGKITNFDAWYTAWQQAKDEAIDRHLDRIEDSWDAID